MLQRDTKDNCRDCRGTGQKLGWGSMFKKCTRCQGTGKYKIDDPGRCQHCDGTGRKPRQQPVEPKKIEQPEVILPPVIPVESTAEKFTPIPAEPVKKIKILQPIANKKGKRK